MYELIDKIIEVSKYTAEDRGDNDISDWECCVDLVKQYGAVIIGHDHILFVHIKCDYKNPYIIVCSCAGNVDKIAEYLCSICGGDNE